jgi:hypothetical protein
MCIKYRGTEYHYGFDVEISSDPQTEHLQILMTKYMKDDTKRPYMYGGICLNNGFHVITEESSRYAALCDILKKILDNNASINKLYAEKYPNMPVLPFEKPIEKSPKFIKIFTRRMKNAHSLDEYRNIQEMLQSLWEKPEFDPEAEDNKDLLKQAILSHLKKILAFFVCIRILPEIAHILYDCKELGVASKMIEDDPQFPDAKIKYYRV